MKASVGAIINFPFRFLTLQETRYGTDSSISVLFVVVFR